MSLGLQAFAKGRRRMQLSSSSGRKMVLIRLRDLQSAPARGRQTTQGESAKDERPLELKQMSQSAALDRDESP